MLVTLKNARTNVALTKKEVVYALDKNHFITITEAELAYYETYSGSIPVEVALSLSQIYTVTIDDIFFSDSSTISYTKDILTAYFDNCLLASIRGRIYNSTFKCIEISAYI